MKKFISSILLAALAATVFAHEGTRVGIVDADLVIQDSAKGKAFFDEYENIIKAKQVEIKAKRDELVEKQKDAQAKAASLSDDKKIELSRELERMQTDLKRMREDAERETQGMLNARLDEFRKELAPLIRQVAQDKNLDMVINYGPNSNLVYFSDAINITADVIKKYDEMQ